MTQAGHVARTGDERKAYKVLVVKPKGNVSLGSLRHRQKEGVKMDLREMTAREGVEWVHLAHNRGQWHALVNTVMNPWVL
jgi:hypothetical protein